MVKVINCVRSWFLHWLQKHLKKRKTTWCNWCKVIYLSTTSALFVFTQFNGSSCVTNVNRINYYYKWCLLVPVYIPDLSGNCSQKLWLDLLFSWAALLEQSAELHSSPSKPTGIGFLCLKQNKRPFSEHPFTSHNVNQRENTLPSGNLTLKTGFDQVHCGEGIFILCRLQKKTSISILVNKDTD